MKRTDSYEIEEGNKTVEQMGNSSVHVNGN